MARAEDIRRAKLRMVREAIARVRGMDDGSETPAASPAEEQRGSPKAGKGQDEPSGP